MSVYVPRNARALMAAMRLGGEVRACRTVRSRRERQVTNPTRWKHGRRGNIGRTGQDAAI